METRQPKDGLSESSNAHRVFATLPPAALFGGGGMCKCGNTGCELAQHALAMQGGGGRKAWCRGVVGACATTYCGG
jgi:hypothetical protein